MNTQLLPVSAPAPYQLYSQTRTPESEESMNLQEASFKPVEQSAAAAGSQQSLTSEEQTYQPQQNVDKKQEELDQQILQKLSTLDREVRNHERAHAAVGGQYAGAPRYEYERGPDGVNYAVAGEVPISTGAIPNDPRMTLEKVDIVRRAALAPAEPSAQDRKVAAEAAQMAAMARVELLKMEQEQRLDEQHQQEKSLEEDAVMNTESTQVNAVKNDHEGMILLQDVESRSSVDDINETQEAFFNEINNELTLQLISLGGAAQSPKSLGSIVNRLV